MSSDKIKFPVCVVTDCKEANIFFYNFKLINIALIFDIILSNIFFTSSSILSFTGRVWVGHEIDKVPLSETFYFFFFSPEFIEVCQPLLYCLGFKFIDLINIYLNLTEIKCKYRFYFKFIN